MRVKTMSPTCSERASLATGSVAGAAAAWSSEACARAWERAGILRPARDPHSGRREYRADDVRDAELAHLLRRGGYRLAHVAAVVDRVRAAGGTAELAALLVDWRERLTDRGRAMLAAAGRLDAYLDLP